MRCPARQEQDGGSVHTSLYVRDARFDTTESMAADTIPALPPGYDDLPSRNQQRERTPAYGTLFSGGRSPHSKQPLGLYRQ